MLKTISIAIVPLVIGMTIDIARADLTTHPNRSLYAQKQTQLNKPIVSQSNLGSQVFSPQKKSKKVKIDFKQTAVKKGTITIDSRSKTAMDCQRLINDREFGKASGEISLNNTPTKVTCSHDRPLTIDNPNNSPSYMLPIPQVNRSASPFASQEKPMPLNGFSPNRSN